MQVSVLLIEDDPDYAQLVRFGLLRQESNGANFCLYWAQSLKDGLGRISCGDIDIVLLDLGLPDSTGKSAYVELRKAAPTVPIIVLTGNRASELEFDVLTCGADDYLNKSVTFGSQLIRSLEGALSNARIRRRQT